MPRPPPPIAQPPGRSRSTAAASPAPPRGAPDGHRSQFLVRPSGEGGEDAAMDRPAPRRGGRRRPWPDARARGGTRRRARRSRRDPDDRQSSIRSRLSPADRVEEPGLGDAAARGRPPRAGRGPRGRGSHCARGRRRGLSRAPASPVARTWVTKNGLPPVVRYSASGSTSCPSASSDRVAARAAGSESRSTAARSRGRRAGSAADACGQPVVAEGGDHERRYVLDPPA